MTIVSRGVWGMRKADFDHFRREVRDKYKRLGLIHVQNPAGRAIRTKPRDPRELKLLLLLAKKRKREALETGEYEIISPRRWRIHGRNP